MYLRTLSQSLCSTKYNSLLEKPWFNVTWWQLVVTRAMSNSLQSPPPATFDIHDGAAAESWKEWRARFECYSVATKLDKEDPAVQVSTLLTVIGAEAHKVFLTFTWATAGDENRLDRVLDKFAEYCQPCVNVLFERFKFNSHCQGAGEPFDQFVTALRQLTSKCDFANVTEESLLRDRILFGISNQKLKEHLLCEADLTLNRTLEICRAAELSSDQLKEVSRLSDNLSVNAIKSTNGRPSGNSGQLQMIKDCHFCGRKHERDKNACPAWGKQCTLCKKTNHFRSKCSRLRGVQSLASDSVQDQRQFSDTELEQNVFTVQSRSINSVRLTDEQTVTLRVRENHYIRFQLDNGADCNVLPVHVYKAATGDHQLVNVKPSSVCLVGFGRKNERSVGQVQLRVWREKYAGANSCRTVNSCLRCELVEGENFHSILGSKACKDLVLIEIKDSDAIYPLPTKSVSKVHVHAVSVSDGNLTKEAVKKQYPTVFQDKVGYIGDYTIKVDANVKPVQHAPRRVPVALRNKLRTELQRLQEEGILVPVTEPTEWISSMVPVLKKDGSLRVCLDPKDLNLAILREHYQLPTIEDISSRLAGARLFTLLDVKQGFWHVKLDSDSSLLTTFNTPFGRYRWARLPFGIASAPEVFQRLMHELIVGLEGVEVIADDFLIYGSDEQTHGANLHAFLKRCVERNVVLNFDKMKLARSEVPFIGHVATDSGLVASPEKVAAVVNMPQPTDEAGVKRFLGMVQYLAKFLPGLSEMTQPLRLLTSKGNNFCWNSSQASAFKAIKLAVSQAPVLRYYCLSDEVTVQCDASKDGLGAALMQCGQPVAFASRALTECESRYAQIEKECLAIVFACERFNSYLYGRDVVNVETDHMPLEAIFKKPLEATPARLQRMRLRLQCYSLNVTYKRGAQMYLADTLSRAVAHVHASELESDSSRELEEVDPTLSLMVSVMVVIG